MCLFACLPTVMAQHRRDQHRVSAESRDKFMAHHRYDSDSSLHLAACTRSVLPHKTFRRSLPRLSAASLHSTGRLSAGTQSHENLHIFSQGLSGSDEAYIKSSGTRQEGNKVNEGEKLISSQGRTRSQDMEASKDWMTDDYSEATEGYLRSSEGHSRSDGTVCVNCGCERSSVITSAAVDDNSAATNHTDAIVAEVGHSQGSAATQKSDGQNNRQESAAVAPLKSGGQSTVSQGTVGTVGPQRDGIFAVESYSGDVSRQLCQQLIDLLSDLNMAQDLNVDVRFTTSLCRESRLICGLFDVFD